MNTCRETCHIVVNENSVDVDSAFGSLRCVDADSVSNMLTCWIYMVHLSSGLE
jgi:hypothetical protein